MKFPTQLQVKLLTRFVQLPLFKHVVLSLHSSKSVLQFLPEKIKEFEMIIGIVGLFVSG